MTKSAVFS